MELQLFGRGQGIILLFGVDVTTVGGVNASAAITCTVALAFE